MTKENSGLSNVRSNDLLDGITGWLISCHNEWCSGPENYKYINGSKPPDEPINCPTCGWPAIRGSGIRALKEAV